MQILVTKNGLAVDVGLRRVMLEHRGQEWAEHVGLCRETVAAVGGS